MEFEVSKEIESVVVSGNSGFCSLRSRNMNTHKSIEEAVGWLLYMMMLRMALNVIWKSPTINTDSYQGLPKVILRIQHRRRRLPGHCIIRAKEITNKLVLCQTMEEKTKRGIRMTIFIDNLLEDTGMEGIQKLKIIMENQDK